MCCHTSKVPWIQSFTSQCPKTSETASLGVYPENTDLFKDLLPSLQAISLNTGIAKLQHRHVCESYVIHDTQTVCHLLWSDPDHCTPACQIICNVKQNHNKDMYVTFMCNITVTVISVQVMHVSHIKCRGYLLLHILNNGRIFAKKWKCIISNHFTLLFKLNIFPKFSVVPLYLDWFLN